MSTQFAVITVSGIVILVAAVVFIGYASWYYRTVPFLVWAGREREQERVKVNA